MVTPTELLGHNPSISRDSLHLYYLDEPEENVMRAERSAPGEPWTNSTMVGEAGAYYWIDVSRDELHLLMGGGSGTTEPMVAIASRESIDEPFGPPIAAGGPLDNSDVATLSDVSWGPGDFQIVVSVDTPDGGDLYASDCLPSDQVPATSE